MLRDRVVSSAFAAFVLALAPSCSDVERESDNDAAAGASTGETLHAVDCNQPEDTERWHQCCFVPASETMTEQEWHDCFCPSLPLRQGCDVVRGCVDASEATETTQICMSCEVCARYDYESPPYPEDYEWSCDFGGAEEANCR